MPTAVDSEHSSLSGKLNFFRAVLLGPGNRLFPSPIMPIPVYKLALALVLLWIVKKLLNIGKREKDLPPGPPTVPVLGNLHIFPTEFTHYKLTEWARQYGDLYSLKLGPGTAIVISSASVVKELMDKRSASTADRPPSHLGHAVTGGNSMGLAPYAATWRILRKATQAILTTQASNDHLPIQKAESTQLVYDILQAPENFFTHIGRYSHSVISSVIYGVRSPRFETREATAFLKMVKLWGKLLEPGAHPPVDLLPFLKYVPERWAPWKRACKEIRSLQRDLYFGLLDQCENRLRNGEGNGSYMEKVLERQEALGIDRELVGYLGGVLMEGGTETTTSFIQSFDLAMVAFPEIQQKAHAELDRVIGTERMPSLEDFENLPYIQAVIKETHRFRPVLPLTIPHASSTTSQFNGYVIPQGTTIFVNIWGIFHDPDAFEIPEIFNPDRFLLTEHGTKLGFDVSDFRSNLAFGSGRRICPGIQMANNSLMLTTMKLLWAFDFNPATDPSTKVPIPANILNYEKGLTCGPLSFQCAITPRRETTADLIQREFCDAIPTFSRFEDGLSVSDKKWLEKTRTTLFNRRSGETFP
ncbi:cytochrome P450, partial [Mycena floridula]